LFAGAVFVLRSQLREHSLEEILDELRAFPRLRLLLALGTTFLGYLALAGYDAISLAALGHRLPFRRVAYAGFLSYAFAKSLPLAVVVGAGVRYRLYSQWGIEEGEAAKVVAYNTVTYVVGLLATAGLAFALQPVLLPGFLKLPLRTARPLGFVCLGVVAAYLIWSSRKGGHLRIWRWELARPSLPLALAQIAISGADWVLAAATLYVLLPQQVPFHVFLAVFLLAEIAILVAQIPAGLGVFEAVMLWSLPPAIPVPALLIGLVGWRLVYYLLPFLLATAIWVVQEGSTWWQDRGEGKGRAAPSR
jgi:uncharacterized membrane protein YbhN (UPF0104 family)